jgi:plastocyanin
MRVILGVTAGVLLAMAVGCGGSGNTYSSANPASPTPSSTSPSNAVVITIVGMNGTLSFTPNPASVPNGQLVVWHNADSVTHHIVLNDGTIDTGDIAPGGTSAAITMRTSGANYHCTIHPTMVGSINTATGAPPPCTGPYC